ncbi:MAG: antibiotic biosynthesis monooxygenase [Planctomycetes bacterium]|nr:antibiotic biosynthesis monooxygenase [Planctomycetota bacterium]
MSIDHVALVCLIQAKQETKEAVKDELVHLTDMTRKEKGNLAYDLHVSSDDDSLFIICENWENRAALDSHIAQPYLQSFLAKQDELLACPIDIKICRLIK